MSITPSITRREVAILDSTMAYLEAGGGGPHVLFLHGNPTSSYIWRNIIPFVAPEAHCIAPDLIGFGRSGKPEIPYRFADHVRYLDAFIEKLALGPIVIVAQDWGTALAFHRASRFPTDIIGLAFMEFIRPFPAWDEFHQRAEARALFQALRTPGTGERLVLEDNVFLERVLPGSILRTLYPTEIASYRAPFPTPASRRPILALPRELPIAGEPADVVATTTRDQDALKDSTYPKLLFCGDPGALVSPSEARAFAATAKNCRLVMLGAGAHYLQEDHPALIGETLASWLREITTPARMVADASAAAAPLGTVE